MAISNITSAASPHPSMKGQGAVIHSVAHDKEVRVNYGVQSATFMRTVFPGQATGSYRINSIIYTGKAQTTAKPGTINSSRATGSPPIPYPPRNATAYYSNQYTRIIPNPSYKAYG